MRGLAFPTAVPDTPEPSDPNGTPTTFGDIPIDPALGGTPLDPAFLSDAQLSVSPKPPPPSVALPQLPDAPPPSEQWSQERLPEGDPFAPQNTMPYLPIIAEPLAPPAPNAKLVKKRRKFHRDEECSFCQGNDAKNKVGEPELMVTCHECGRSGHPSCMQLSNIGDMLRSYPWKCIECKNCEVCLEKGDDERILFCDGCDRGWHFDCMDPPIDEVPEGEWYCPPCQEAAAQQQFYHQQAPLPLPPPEMLNYGEIQPPPYPIPSEQPIAREQSVASSSNSIPVTAPSSRVRGGGKKGRPRKVRQQVHDTTDEGEEVDVEVSTLKVAPSKVRNPSSSWKPGRRGRPPKVRPVELPTEAEEESEDEDEEEDVDVDVDEELYADMQMTPVRPRPRKRKRDSSPPSAGLPRVRLRLPTTRTSVKGKEKEEPEEQQGMFDGILSVEDRDTSKTTIMNHDKHLFEKSKQEAERKIAPPPSSTTTAHSLTHHFSRASISETHDASIPIAGPSRPTRSVTATTALPPPPAHLHSPSLPTPSPVPSTPGPSSFYTYTRGDLDTLRIKTIRFGRYDIRTWYDAPFPEEYASIPDGRMWICEFCLKYMKSRFQASRHRLKCKVRHPPGDEIYRDGTISIFEVDGRKNKIYCQNLCLLSKMFLDHKSLFYDVEPFLFYVITEVDDVGARFVGYFSKEKRSPKDYNVSCIMTLPVRQRQGWGNFLIDFSYLLSKVERRPGSPEKPLSNLGAIGYRSYWTLAVMRYLEHAPDNPRLEEISAATAMTLEDIYETLAQQSMIFIREPTPPPVRPSPGQAIRINRRKSGGLALRRTNSSSSQLLLLQRAPSRYKSQDPGNGHSDGHHDSNHNHAPFVLPRHYEVRFDREKVREYVRQWEKKGYVTVNPEKLQWTPYLLSRTEVREVERIKEKGKGKANVKERERDGEQGSYGKKEVNGMNGAASTSPVSNMESKIHVHTPMVNGGLQNGASNTPRAGKRPSESPAPFTPGDSVMEPEDDVEMMLPVHVPKRRKVDGIRRESGRQTPQGSRRGRNSENGQDGTTTPTVVLRGLRSRSSHAGTRTPTPTKGGVEEGVGSGPRTGWESSIVEDDERFAARLALEEKQKQGVRLLRSRTSENGKRDGGTAAAAKASVVNPTKRRKVAVVGGDESARWGCPVISLAPPDENGREDGRDVDEVDAEGEMEFKSEEDGGTPLTSVTSPSDDAVVLSMEVTGKVPELPVSDERSTLETEIEVGDEDAEGEPDLECSI